MIAFNKSHISNDLIAEKGTFSLSDLFKVSGEPISIILTTFVLDFNWILNEIPLVSTVPTTIIHNGTLDINEVPSTVKFIEAPLLEEGYSIHHTKIIIIQHTKGLRFVLSTSNLTEDDYEYKTQGMYIDDFNFINDEEDNRKGKNFRNSLKIYFDYVGMDSSFIDKYCFNNVKGWLLISIPGKYTGNDVGLRQLSKIIREKTKKKPKTLYAQVSSVGNLNSYFINIFKRGFKLDRDGEIKIIWPTEEYVRQSYDGYFNGAELCLREKVYNSNKEMFYVYNSSVEIRNKLTPHIKTYRAINDAGNIVYDILTSANLSVSAWGRECKGTLYINNYEMGMLFFGETLELPYLISECKPFKEEKPWFRDVDHEIPDVNNLQIINGKIVENI